MTGMRSNYDLKVSRGGETHVEKTSQSTLVIWMEMRIRLVDKQ